MRLLKLIAFLLTFFTLFSQNKYINPRFKELAKEHKEIALLPFKVIIDNSSFKEKVSYEDLKKIQKEEAYSFQQKFYFTLLAKQSKWDIPIKLKSPEETNELLSKNNIDYFDIPNIKKQKLAEVLDVDAILYGTLRVNKPMSEAASAVIGLLTGYWFPTTHAELDIQLYDRKTGELLWYYKTQVDGYGSIDELASYLAKRVWKKIPYRDK